MASGLSGVDARYYARELLLFYNYIADANFSSLSSEDLENVQKYVTKWYYFFHNKTYGPNSLMAFTAEKMRISNGYYGPKTKEEKALFYILMVDPDLLFLEVFESANTVQERRDLALLNFRIVDTRLMRIEKKLNDHFNILKEDDIWALERIKKDR